MCGGRGTRLGGAVEKPLTPVAGRPMVDRVCDALAASRVEATHAVVSPHAPETRERLVGICEDRSPPSLRVVDAPGDGYVADLRYAMGADGGGTAGAEPLLTVAADLPLLDAEAVNGVIDAARAAGDDDAPTSLTVVIPAARKRNLGVSADAATEVDGREVVPAGINVVGGGSGTEGDVGATDESETADDEGDAAVHRTEDVRLAVNVNYPSDVRVAERLLAGSGADE
ncbi:NTP transferase domain-containing protein [Halorubrum sp. AD140]|uniref:NTP transferase domain-containing protein n=1 Tax=Halorubrum sp. AD140 TaxID=3050073 RepID=UPI002ACC6562|nr:NTP transferase domain-containing protein [Halorubrum sp. AD140]MDZ5811155.1 NTP transferase domain-containing protein [Halorubrum sp. AD140]